jgi:nucleoside 2-deoxyribosyltransferase
MMPMDPEQPMLEDVNNTIKDVCSEFDIEAVRADDVEHSRRITDVVIEHIERCEFLIADLTNARPNVYYEIGYAHALDKRPILYRKEGAELHFDLSVHNVPEYRNITDLREKLRDRFEAILGRRPNAG